VQICKVAEVLRCAGVEKQPKVQVCRCRCGGAGLSVGVGAEVQKCRSAEVQGRRGQGYSCAEVWRNRGEVVQICKVAEVQRCRETEVQVLCRCGGAGLSVGVGAEVQRCRGAEVEVQVLV
jgi:hypothetical protein